MTGHTLILLAAGLVGVWLAGKALDLADTLLTVLLSAPALAAAAAVVVTLATVHAHATP